MFLNLGVQLPEFRPNSPKIDFAVCYMDKTLTMLYNKGINRECYEADIFSDRGLHGDSKMAHF